MKTKKELVQEKIDSNLLEIMNMEIVKDFNLQSDHKEAKVQVDAANNKIKQCEIQLTFLREYIQNLE